MNYQDDDDVDSIATELLEQEEAADLVTPTGEQMPLAKHAERHDAVRAAVSDADSRPPNGRSGRSSGRVRGK